MATQLVTKGPLASALSQWLFLGFGTIVIFSGDNAASQAVQNFLRLVGGNGAKLLQDASQSRNLMPQQPIVIHNISPATSNSLAEKNWKGELTKFLLGASAAGAVMSSFRNCFPSR
jgi:hypothetical protein